MAWNALKSVSLTSCVAVLFLLACSNTPPVDAANILGVFTSHSASHLIVHMSVVKALAEQGHNVTVVVAQKPKVTHKNINVIEILPTAEQEQSMERLMSEISEKENGLITMLKMMLDSMTLMVDMQYDVLRDPRMTSLYSDAGNKFDLVIAGWFFNDFVLGVAGKFKAPLIVDWTASPMDMTNLYIGNPGEWAYVPNMMIGIKAGESMTFVQRVQNFLGGSMYSLMMRILNSRWEAYYNKLFPETNFPTYDEIRKNVSLVFCNSHFTEGPIRPNVPALIEIGGIQVKEKPNKLPTDIEAHLNSSTKHGAIYFCLGSNIKSVHVKPEKVAAIFKVLSSLEQNVIWKWDDLENLPGKSKNILYKKWLPQDDILAHPNVKLFITHAGKGGLAESQYHGVPMVALPIFADQTGNAAKMAASGYGLELNMKKLTEEEFRTAVVEVVSNPMYRENVQRYSKMYRDRPMTAKESVVYWAEYVMRHHGARHMQSPLVHLNGFQAANLDVIGLIFVILFISIKLLKFTFRFVCSKICTKCSKSKSGKSKKVKQQ